MKLREVLAGMEILSCNADLEMDITGVESDSRKVMEGNIFVAVSGFSNDGNRFIPMALEKGAKVVVTAKKPEYDVPYVLVPFDRLAMAFLSSNFYGKPSEKMIMIGVTGTNGKTSVTWLLKQVLEKTIGAKVGLIGTMENHIGDVVEEAQHTTPESVDLQKLFARMVDAGCTHCVMEVSSHAIALERVAGVRFQVGAITNLTEDHLDFHKSMEAYAEAKTGLFRASGRAVMNADDSWFSYFADRSECPVITISAEKPSDLCAKNIRLLPNGVSYTAVLDGHETPVEVPIPGRFTVYNSLTVLAIAAQLGIDLASAARALGNVRGVKGRVEVVPTVGKSYTVLIDYAHTPDGLENVLSSVRGFCKGRLIAVFGCGGDRDPIKRPIMGKIAAEIADIAIVTSDNPRTEDPVAIIEDVLRGIDEHKEKCNVVENREKAIQYAMDIAEKDDIIVLAGKGHETYQIIGKTKYPMDEREIVTRYLAEKR